jgi:hypothetical protein
MIQCLGRKLQCNMDDFNRKFWELED